MLHDLPEYIKPARPVGSRVTCDPAPTNTDADFLAYVEPARLEHASCDLTLLGFKRGGSVVLNESAFLHPDERFVSWTRGEANLLVTASPAFYRRFVAATSIARRLNLLHKPDRIALFQAVLYGNAVEAKDWDEPREVGALP